MNVLSQSSRVVLEEFASSKVLLAFDYDGTLAPIVTDPRRARMRARSRDLLLGLTRHFPVVVISGRAQSDLVKKLRGSGVSEMIGNHGMEPRHASSRYIVEVERWLPLIRAAVAAFTGVVVEDKGYSVAIHYRLSRKKKAVRATIFKVASALGDVRVIGGKQVVNILPHGAPHKGIALERARDRLHCDTAIYVGDDETDEDVFALDQPGRLLSIRVGKKRESAAMYYLVNQGAIDDFLAALIECRRRSSRRTGTAG